MPELRHVFVVNPVDIGGGTISVDIAQMGSCGDPHPSVMTVQGCAGMEPLSVTGEFTASVDVVVDFPTGACGAPNGEVLTIQGCDGMTPISVIGVTFPTGICGTPNSGVLTIQGCDGMTPVSVAGEFTASVDVVFPTGPCGTPNPEVLTIQGCAGMEPVEITGDINVLLPTGDCGSPNPSVLTIQGCSGMTPLDVTGDVGILGTVDVNIVGQPISVIGDFSIPTGTCGNPNAEVLTIQGCDGMTPLSVTGDFLMSVAFPTAPCGEPSPEVLTVQGCEGMEAISIIGDVGITGPVSVVEPIDVNVLNPVSDVCVVCPIEVSNVVGVSITNEPISVTGDFLMSVTFPTGTCGDPNAEVLTVQGCEGMQPFDVNVANAVSITEPVDVSVLNPVTVDNIVGVSITNEPVSVTGDFLMSVTFPTGECGDPNSEVLTVQGCEGMQAISITGDVNVANTVSIDGPIDVSVLNPVTVDNIVGVSITNEPVSVTGDFLMSVTFPTGECGDPNAEVLTVQGCEGMQPFDVNVLNSISIVEPVDVNVLNPVSEVTVDNIVGVSITNEPVSVTGDFLMSVTFPTGECGDPNSEVLTIQGCEGMTPVSVTGDFLMSITFPTGTCGAPDAEVLTIQGCPGMVPISIDDTIPINVKITGQPVSVVGEIEVMFPTGDCGTPNPSVLTVQGCEGMTPVSVTGEFLASITFPTGTCGDPNVEVLTVQGCEGMQAISIAGDVNVANAISIDSIVGVSITNEPLSVTGEIEVMFPTGDCGTPNPSVLTIQGCDGMTPVSVTGDFLMSVSFPTGECGDPNVEVLTVQGCEGMQPLDVNVLNAVSIIEPIDVNVLNPVSNVTVDNIVGVSITNEPVSVTGEIEVMFPTGDCGDPNPSVLTVQGCEGMQAISITGDVNVANAVSIDGPIDVNVLNPVSVDNIVGVSITNEPVSVTGDFLMSVTFPTGECGDPNAEVLTIQGCEGMTPVSVTGDFLMSVSFPTGSCGDPNVEVLTIQGCEGMQPLDVNVLNAVSIIEPIDVNVLNPASNVTVDNIVGVSITNEPVSVTGEIEVMFPTGDCGTPNPSVLTIQGCEGMTPVSVTGDFLMSVSFPTGVCGIPDPEVLTVQGCEGMQAISITGDVNVANAVSIDGPIDVNVLNPVSNVTVDNIVGVSITNEPVSVTGDFLMSVTFPTGECGDPNAEVLTIQGCEGMQAVSVVGDINVLNPISLIEPVSVTGEIEVTFPTGDCGDPNPSVLTIQGCEGMTPVSVTGEFLASITFPTGTCGDPNVEVLTIQGCEGMQALDVSIIEPIDVNVLNPVSNVTVDNIVGVSITNEPVSVTGEIEVMFPTGDCGDPNPSVLTIQGCEGMTPVSVTGDFLMSVTFPTGECGDPNAEVLTVQGCEGMQAISITGDVNVANAVSIDGPIDVNVLNPVSIDNIVGVSITNEPVSVTGDFLMSVTFPTGECGDPNAEVLTIQGCEGMAPVSVTGDFLMSVSFPTGSCGDPNAEVLTVQGCEGMQAISITGDVNVANAVSIDGPIDVNVLNPVSNVTVDNIVGVSITNEPLSVTGEIEVMFPTGDCGDPNPSVLTIQGCEGMTPVSVTGDFLMSVSFPTGECGDPNVEVLTVQGCEGMEPLDVNVLNPISIIEPVDVNVLNPVSNVTVDNIVGVSITNEPLSVTGEIEVMFPTGDCGDPNPSVLTIQGCDGMTPVSVTGEIANIDVIVSVDFPTGDCGDPCPSVITIQGCEGMQAISITGDVNVLNPISIVEPVDVNVLNPVSEVTVDNIVGVSITNEPVSVTGEIEVMFPTGDCGDPNPSVLTIQGCEGMTPVSVTGDFLASISFPTGTCGDPNAEVLTIQGCEGMQAISITGDVNVANAVSIDEPIDVNVLNPVSNVTVDNIVGVSITNEPVSVTGEIEVMFPTGDCGDPNPSVLTIQGCDGMTPVSVTGDFLMSVSFPTGACGVPDPEVLTVQGCEGMQAISITGDVNVLNPISIVEPVDVNVLNPISIIEPVDVNVLNPVSEVTVDNIVGVSITNEPVSVTGDFGVTFPTGDCGDPNPSVLTIQGCDGMTPVSVTGEIANIDVIVSVDFPTGDCGDPCPSVITIQGCEGMQAISILGDVNVANAVSIDGPIDVNVLNPVSNVTVDNIVGVSITNEPLSVTGEIEVMFPTGDCGDPNPSVLTIQGCDGMTPVSVTGDFLASIIFPTGTCGDPNVEVLTVQGCEGMQAISIAGDVNVLNPISIVEPVDVNVLNPVSNVTVDNIVGVSITNEPLSVTGEIEVMFPTGDCGDPNPSVLTIQGCEGMTPVSVTGDFLMSVSFPTGVCGIPDPEVLTVQGCEGMQAISITGDVNIANAVSIDGPIDVNVLNPVSEVTVDNIVGVSITNEPVSVTGDFGVTFPTGDCGDPNPSVLTIQGCDGMTPVSVTGEIANIDVIVSVDFPTGDCGDPCPSVITIQGCEGMQAVSITGDVNVANAISIVEPVDVNVLNPVSSVTVDNIVGVSITNEPVSVTGDFGVTFPTGDCGDPNPSVLTIQGCDGMTPVSVTGDFLASIIFPTGTCGDPNVEVLTVQGCEGMEAISITGDVNVLNPVSSVTVDNIVGVSITNEPLSVTGDFGVTFPTGDCGDPNPSVLTIQGCDGMTPVSVTGDIGLDVSFIVEFPTGDCGDPNPSVITIQGCEGMQAISIVGDVNVLNPISIVEPVDVNILNPVSEVTVDNIVGVSITNEPLSVTGDFGVTFPTGDCGDPNPSVLTIQGCEGMTPISVTGEIANIDFLVSVDFPTGDCGDPCPSVITIQGCEGMQAISVIGEVDVVFPVGDCGDPNPSVLTIQGCGGMTPVSVTGEVDVIFPTGDCGDPNPSVLTVQGCENMTPISVIVVSQPLGVDVNNQPITISSDHIEDDPHITGDIGTFVLGVRNDTASTITSDDGDYSPIAVDDAGRVGITDLGGSITVDGDISVTSIGTTVEVVGNVANDDADSGNPVKIGAQARQTNPTAVADGDRVNIITDDLGRLVVVANHVRDQVGRQYTAISGNSETTIVTAGGAGVFRDLTMLIISSDDNNLEFTIRDSTAGATAMLVRLDADQNVVMNFDPPFKQTTANNNWTIQSNSGGAVFNVTVQFVNNI